MFTHDTTLNFINVFMYHPLCIEVKGFKSRSF